MRAAAQADEEEYQDRSDRHQRTDAQFDGSAEVESADLDESPTGGGAFEPCAQAGHKGEAPLRSQCQRSTGGTDGQKRQYGCGHALAKGPEWTPMEERKEQ
jgi:hypothetical protein